MKSFRVIKVMNPCGGEFLYQPQVRTLGIWHKLGGYGQTYQWFRTEDEAFAFLVNHFEPKTVVTKGRISRDTMELENKTVTKQFEEWKQNRKG